VWEVASLDQRHRIVTMVIEYLLSYYRVVGATHPAAILHQQLDWLLEPNAPSSTSGSTHHTSKRPRHHEETEQSNNKSSNDQQTSNAKAANHTPFYIVSQELNKLSKLLMEIDNKSLVPLQIESVRGAHPAFRYTSPLAPLPHPLLDPNNKYAAPTTSAQLYSEPLDVVLQLENSKKWPEDIVALRWVKCAFYLSIAKALKQQYQLTCVATPHFVDILSSGFTFRARIRLDKELSLLAARPYLPSMRRISAATSMFDRSSSGEPLDRDDVHRTVVLRPTLNSLLHTLYLKHLSYGAAARYVVVVVVVMMTR
jgi:hypothetical protein